MSKHFGNFVVRKQRHEICPMISSLSGTSVPGNPLSPRRHFSLRLFSPLSPPRAFGNHGAHGGTSLSITPSNRARNRIGCSGRRCAIDGCYPRERSLIRAVDFPSLRGRGQYNSRSTGRVVATAQRRARLTFRTKVLRVSLPRRRGKEKERKKEKEQRRSTNVPSARARVDRRGEEGGVAPGQRLIVTCGIHSIRSNRPSRSARTADLAPICAAA